MAIYKCDWGTLRLKNRKDLITEIGQKKPVFHYWDLKQILLSMEQDANETNTPLSRYGLTIRQVELEENKSPHKVSTFYYMCGTKRGKNTLGFQNYFDENMNHTIALACPPSRDKVGANQVVNWDNFKKDG